jgi:hypothetical protein
MNKPLLTLLIGMINAIAMTTAAVAEIVLAAPGKAPAPILLAKDASPATREAAMELAHYLEKISGQRPPVYDEIPAPLPESAIWVGLQPRVAQLFPQTNVDFKQTEEILITASDKHLLIAGRDRWDPQHPTKQTKHGDLPHQQEYGTCNAVYTFIQERLGVRWLWPGELGEDVPRRATLAFAPFEQRFHPPLYFRRGIQWWLCRPANRGKLSVDWGRRQRIYLDASNNLLALLNEGHGFDNWWDRLHTTHPEYFALQPDGTRSGYPQPDRVKMCLTNPGVADEWLAQVGRLLQEDPTLTFFNASENDNHLAGYCVCANCEAWDAPQAPKYRLDWKGVVREHVAVSDRQIRFANRVAEKLRDRYPGKGYKVVVYAYGPSASAPLGVKPDPDVVVAQVPNMWEDMEWEDQWSITPTTSARHISDWAATGAHCVWRPNLHSLGGLYQGLPDVPVERAVACFRHVVVDNHAEGVGFAHFQNFWPTQGPLYYVLAQLAWNPKQDHRTLLTDYYQRGFGKAAPLVRQYWQLLETTRNKVRDEGILFPQFSRVYDAAFFQQASRLLDEADQILAHEPEIYRRRVQFVRSGLDFTREVITLRDMKNRYVETGRKDKTLAIALTTSVAKLERQANGNLETVMGPVIAPQFLALLLPETQEKAKAERKDLQ